MYRVSAIAFWLSVAASGTFAQQGTEGRPEPTRIGTHRIGESFQEWLSAEPSLTLICQRDWPEGSCGPSPTLGNREVADWMKEINSFDACERNRTGNARSCKDLSAVRDGNGRIETTREKQTYDWELRDGKLAKLTIADPDASIDCGYNPDIGQLLGFLAQKYGKPSERKVTYQNGFGATWDLSRSTWDMPDGTTIIAGEMLGRQCVPGRRRELVIIFMSGELVKNEERNKQNKANPFDK